MSFEEKYYSIPTITRTYLTAAFLTTASCALGILDPMQLYLDFDLIWYKFEIWRFVTCFLFFGMFSMKFAFNLYLLYNYSSAYEQSPFCSDGSPRNEGTTADYLFMLMIGGSILTIVSYFFPLYFLGEAVVFLVLYVWSRRNPMQPCSFFGFRFNGQYLPFVYCAFNLIIGKSPVVNILGIAAGHVYYFLLKIAPVTYGWDIIRTPRILIDFFDASQYTQSYTASGNVVRGNRPAGGRWGGGRRLGGGN